MQKILLLFSKAKNALKGTLVHVKYSYKKITTLVRKIMNTEVRFPIKRMRMYEKKIWVPIILFISSSALNYCSFEVELPITDHSSFSIDLFQILSDVFHTFGFTTGIVAITKRNLIDKASNIAVTKVGKATFKTLLNILFIAVIVFMFVFIRQKFKVLAYLAIKAVFIISATLLPYISSSFDIVVPFKDLFSLEQSLEDDKKQKRNKSKPIIS